MSSPPLRARLFARVGPLTGASFSIGREATLGRSPDNDVVLTAPSVSARHGRIFWDPEEECYRLEDLGSRNGTTVCGLPVHEPERLGRLEVIELGAAGELIFQVLEGERAQQTDLHLAVADLLPPAPAVAAGEAAEHTAIESIPPPPLPPGIGEAPKPAGRGASGDTIYESLAGWVLPPVDPGGPDAAVSPGPAAQAPSGPAASPARVAPPSSPPLPPLPPLPPEDRPAPPSPPPAAAEGFLLELESAEAGTLRLPLSPGVYVLGRGVGADLVVGDATLSRPHARLLVSAAGVRVVDLRSSNGTRVAGVALEPGSAVPLEPGSEIELGSVRGRLVRGPIDPGDLADPAAGERS